MSIECVGGPWYTDTAAPSFRLLFGLICSCLESDDRYLPVYHHAYLILRRFVVDARYREVRDAGGTRAGHPKPIKAAYLDDDSCLQFEKEIAPCVFS
jgi:hypothetical protein